MTLLTVVAAIADKNNNIKRLNNESIKFEIEGAAEIVADGSGFYSEVPVKWGTAPILIRSATTPGKIRIKASVVLQGVHKPLHAEMEIESKPAENKHVFDVHEASLLKIRKGKIKLQSSGTNNKDTEKLLKEVERQQENFGEKK